MTTDLSNSRNLIMYNLTNDNEVILHDDIRGIATHLTVDTANKTVYWILFTTETNYKILKTTYDNQTSQIGPDQTGTVDSVDIAVGFGHFYVLDSGGIRKYNKTTNTLAETISLPSEATGMIVLAGKQLL